MRGEKRINKPKYSTISINATIGLGGSLVIETHRFIELGGTLVFLNLDIFDSKHKSIRYFSVAQEIDLLK
jgi:hypothetical protein